MNWNKHPFHSQLKDYQHMRFIKATLFGVLLFLSIGSNAQTILKAYEEDKSRIFYGTGLNGSLESRFSWISFDPFVGYAITPKLSIGLETPFSFSFGRKKYMKHASVGVGAFARFKI